MVSVLRTLSVSQKRKVHFWTDMLAATTFHTAMYTPFNLKLLLDGLEDDNEISIALELLPLIFDPIIY